MNGYPALWRSQPALTTATWLLALLFLAACTVAPQASVETVKLTVEADGIYTVSAEALAQAGFDLIGASPEQLSLTSGGAAVAFQVVGEGRDRSLRFYGQAPGPDAYTARNIYWLSRKTTEQPPPLITARDASPPAGPTFTTIVTATLHSEERRYYRGLAKPGENRWYWEALFAPAEITVNLDVPHATGDEARLRLGLYGVSSSPAINPDHHLTLWFNGVWAADIHWDGQGPHVTETTLAPGTVRPGKNQLKFSASGDTGVAVDSIQLDWIELTYRRELETNGDALRFTGAAPGFMVRATAEPIAAWDITDPLAPVALAGHKWQQSLLHFASDGMPRQFIVASKTGLRRPATITAATGPDLRDWPGGADIIVVMVPAFREALQPLVTARQAQGLRVAVVDVEQVYDTFNFGRAGPEAIRALVQYALAHWTPPAPRFLLLAGDASYDPRGYLGGTERDLVPTQTVFTTFSGWTSSDVWHALSDEGPGARPALAVGRLPAQTAEQLANMVAKILAYERQEAPVAWRKTALLIADNDEPGFAEETREFIDRLAGYTADEVLIAGDGSAACNTLLQAFAAGRGLIGYFGHGSMTSWAKEKILGVDDAEKLNNRDRLPIVFTVTCLSGLFEHPTTPSLGEALLRAKNGGAVAALVPSSAAVLTRPTAAGTRTGGRPGQDQRPGCPSHSG
ncbi:MAG: C25 family cysteine peptidase [Anaerolineae bacterium]